VKGKRKFDILKGEMGKLKKKDRVRARASSRRGKGGEPRAKSNHLRGKGGGKSIAAGGMKKRSSPKIDF